MIAVASRPQPQAVEPIRPLSETSPEWLGARSHVQHVGAPTVGKPRVRNDWRARVGPMNLLFQRMSRSNLHGPVLYANQKWKGGIPP